MADRVDLERGEEAARRQRAAARQGNLGLLVLLGVAVLTVIGLPLVLRWHEANPALSLAGIAVLLFVTLAGMVLGVWLWGRSLKIAIGKQEKAREVVSHVVDGVPPGAAPTSERAVARLGLRSVGLVALFVLLFVGWPLLLARLWPSPPLWVEWAPFAIAMLLGPPLVSRLRPRPASEPATPRLPLWRELLQGAGWLLFLAVLVVLPGPLLRWLVPPGASPITVGLVILGGAAGLFLVVLPLLQTAPSWWVYRDMARGDYEGALRRLRFLRSLSPRNAGFLFMQGTVLLMAGRYQDSEQLLRESLTEGRKGAADVQSVALENLGFVLLEQERYDEARQAFEGSLAIRADRGGPYDGLAQIELRQAREAARALELVERALEYKRRTLMSRNVDRYVLGEMLADRAWALALLGRHDEARQALDAAFRETDRSFKPMLAGIHYRGGPIARLRGDEAGAREHLERARAIDPHGSYGARAGRLLAEIGGRGIGGSL